MVQSRAQECLTHFPRCGQPTRAFEAGTRPSPNRDSTAVQLGVAAIEADGPGADEHDRSNGPPARNG